MHKLTELIVRRPVSAIIIIAAIIVFGLIALMSMPQELNPDMDMPMLAVITVFPGAGPEDVERLVTSEIADSLSAQSGVRNIISQSMENMSFVMLQFEFGFDMERAYTDVSRAMDTAAHGLPEDALAPMVWEFDIQAQPVMFLSVSSDSRDNLLHFIEDEIVPQLERLSSVAEVSVTGGQQDYVRVEVIEERLREHRLHISNVISAVGGVNHTAPLGSAEFGDVDLAVRVQVRHETIEDLNRIPLTLWTGDVIRLADVANVHISTQDATSISRHNGNENISISIQRPAAVSANRTSADVNRVLNSISAEHPDLDIMIIHDDSEFIADSIRSVAMTLILAIILSMIVLYLFLGDLRASLIVGSSMPISLLVTFIFMDFMGFSLNVVSLSGLIIGVGMMVDNAIVVIDSCSRELKERKLFRVSAVIGTKTVMLSIFAVTLTTVAVFVPLATVDGMAGQMFAPIGFAIVFALLASLMSAITLVPLFFARFKPIERDNAPVARIFNRLESGYARVLSVVLRRKIIVILATVGIMVLSFFLASFLNFELMPMTDDGIISVSVSTRPGLHLDMVDEILVELEEIIGAHPDVENFTLSTGGGGMMMMGGGGGGNASLTAYLYANRSMSTSEVIEQWRLETMHILNSDIDISPVSMTGVPGGGNIEIMLEGETLDGIRDGSAMVEALMEAHPGIIRVNSTVARANPQAEIVVDPLLAAARNITPQMVTGSIFVALNGSEVTDITIGGQRYSIRVTYPRGRYESVSDIANMTLMSATGASVPLSDIAAIEFSDIPQTIVRQNGFYTATITGVPTDAARFTAAAELNRDADELTLPAGVYIGRGMMDEMMTEELTTLGMAIITAILLVFMVMAIQFESIRHSLMVMTCVPLAVIGSFLLMFLTGTTISMVSMLGFLVLIGLVVNNGILFVDTANKYRKEMELHEALIHAGRTRLRPILMITLTSVLAMLPLALGIGDNLGLMQGLGITVIGGLTASTALALILLPTFYLLIDGNPEKRAERKRIRAEKRAKQIGITETEEEQE
ncbi:MAG: efflux RND transporter permease subunit [Defluviitaleaceae bacterium]|nr:efflux RND transporter permease subunit [Defluviitaleaceae bacterium]